jgi:Immunity protein 27
VKCRCANAVELWDAEAKRYADEHLDEVEVRAEGWEVLYRCPQTNAIWLEDYPRGAEHGGGPMHLRRLEAGEGDPPAGR